MALDLAGRCLCRVRGLAHAGRMPGDGSWRVDGGASVAPGTPAGTLRDILPVLSPLHTQPDPLRHP